MFGGMYALPAGRGKAILSSPNGFVQALAGNWNVGTIVSLHSGEALEREAGGDIANVGGGTQRCNQIGDAYGGMGFQQTKTSWLNPAAFNTIPYTFGTEGRNNLHGPSYKDVDFNAFKEFPLGERAKIWIRERLSIC